MDGKATTNSDTPPWVSRAHTSTITGLRGGAKDADGGGESNVRIPTAQSACRIPRPAETPGIELHKADHFFHKQAGKGRATAPGSVSSTAPRAAIGAKRITLYPR